jgi:hypothetical protein
MPSSARIGLKVLAKTELHTTQQEVRHVMSFVVNCNTLEKYVHI